MLPLEYTRSGTPYPTHEALMKTAALLFGSILLALLAGCATSSQQAQGAGSRDALAQKEPAKSFDPDEIICVTERVVGTNIPERICRTRRQMEDERDATQIMMQTMNNKNALRGN